jgi:hypothetical protein
VLYRGKRAEVAPTDNGAIARVLPRPLVEDGTPEFSARIVDTNIVEREPVRDIGEGGMLRFQPSPETTEPSRGDEEAVVGGLRRSVGAGSPARLTDGASELPAGHTPKIGDLIVRGRDLLAGEAEDARGRGRAREEAIAEQDDAKRAETF